LAKVLSDHWVHRLMGPPQRRVTCKYFWKYISISNLKVNKKEKYFLLLLKLFQHFALKKIASFFEQPFVN
jgi:hypothetical protein